MGILGQISFSGVHAVEHDILITALGSRSLIGENLSQIHMLHPHNSGKGKYAYGQNQQYQKLHHKQNLSSLFLCFFHPASPGLLRVRLLLIRPVIRLLIAGAVGFPVILVIALVLIVLAISLALVVLAVALALVVLAIVLAIVLAVAPVLIILAVALIIPVLIILILIRILVKIQILLPVLL